MASQQLTYDTFHETIYASTLTDNTFRLQAITVLNQGQGSIWEYLLLFR